MNKGLVSILIVGIIAALWIPQAMAISDCTEPITIAGMEFLLGGDIITDLNGQSLNDAADSTTLFASRFLRQSLTDREED